MRALQDDLGDGGGALCSPRINIEHLDGQRVANVQSDVREGDMLPTPRVRQMDHTEGMVVMQEADRFDASETLERALRMQASIGDIDSIEGRSIQLPREIGGNLKTSRSPTRAFVHAVKASASLRAETPPAEFELRANACQGNAHVSEQPPSIS
jgi:hypothetical protein